jgi:hypothetical protein
MSAMMTTVMMTMRRKWHLPVADGVDSQVRPVVANPHHYGGFSPLCYNNSKTEMYISMNKKK